MITASRPALQIFPPAEKPPKRDGNRPAPPPAAPRQSSERSKTPGDYHELIIQVPAARHRSPPPQIAYMPPQPPAPIHVERTLRRTPSPAFNGVADEYAFSNDGASTYGTRSPVSEYPTRTYSLAGRAGGPQHPVTPPNDRRYASGPTASRTPDAAPQLPPIFGSANRDARGWSPRSGSDVRAMSPASGLTGSPTLVRTMSGRTVGRSPISPQEKTEKKQLEYIPMQSMFPEYNPMLPLEAQDYRPTRPVVSPDRPREQISKAPYSPPPTVQPSRQQFITPASELHRLWDASNGMVTSPSGPTNVSLQLNRPGASSRSNASAKEKPLVTIGPSAKESFYSLRQSNLEPEVVTDPSGQTHTLQDYELLVFRHNPSRPDILPIAHMDVSPPPPPSLSTTHSVPVAPSSGFPLDVEAHAHDAQRLPHHITTITPTIATLTALSASASSPAASAIALHDPNADSPQARRLAEKAVRAAEDQESVEIMWRRTGPSSGAYELLHPAIGVMKIRIDGDVSGKLDVGSPNPNRAAKISLENPTPTSPGEKSSSYFSGNDEADDATLASLDLGSDVLDVNMRAIHKLRNPYLFDVSVCALLAVAAAESRRAEDPGLKFDAPPPSQLQQQQKGTTKPKPQGKLERKQKPRDENGLEELPRATRGVLAVIRVLGKSVLWILTLGVKVVLAIFRGIFRCFVKPDK